MYTRAWGADGINARVQLTLCRERQLQEERILLLEELRIKDVRIARTAPRRRPYYGPHERMAIQELRAARGWSRKQTVDTFLVTPGTMASLANRIDEQGTDATV